MEKASLTSIGDSLRDKVFDLLKATGKLNVHKEYNLAGKKADVYFEDQIRFYGKLRVAIECKNYSTKLGVSEIGKIIYDYDSSRDGNFDRLIILHREGLEANAQLKVRSKEWISVKTYNELYFELLNFHTYLNEISTLFNSEGLEHYFVSPKDTHGNEIEGVLETWINDESNKDPVAILAGYGMGKTSLSYKLAKQMAEKFLQGEPCRIPIYIRLGDFVSETSVESLICKTFSSTFNVDGFNYERFRKLNELGHFLILFDGFDEMKHAMPFLFIKKVFRNIYDLVLDNSKVVVLGRPSAFTTEEEKDVILHGKEKCGEVVLSNPDLPKFNIIAISDFDEQRASEFIKRYFSYRQNRLHLSARMKSEEFRKQRLNELAGNEYKELIRRPVHARMLVELSLSHEEPMEAISRYHLYDRFINLIYERECDKEAREHISTLDRRRFIEKVAYHFWKKDGTRNFHIKEIMSIKHNLSNADIHKTGDDLYRELLIGSVLERKDDDYYFFGHRSFQEFLVASSLFSKDGILASEFPNIAKFCNEEILTFISEGERPNNFIAFCEASLAEYHGEIEPVLVKFLIKNCHAPVVSLFDVYKYENGPWNAYIRANTLNVLTYDSPLHHIGGISDQSYQFMSGMLGLLTNDNLLADTETLVSFVIGLMHQFCFQALSNSVAQKKSNTAVNNLEYFSAVRVLLNSIEPGRKGKDEISTLDVEYSRLVDSFAGELFSRVGISPVYYRENQRVRIPLISLKANLGLLEEESEEYLPVLRRFWRSKPNIREFANVIAKAPPARRPILTLDRNQK